MIELLICFLVGICILMLCSLIFALGRVFENTIIIRELDEKLELLNWELAKILKIDGEDNEGKN